MFGMQTDLLFPVHAVSPSGPLPKGAEPLEVRAPDGVILRGVSIPPVAPPEGPKLLVVGFGGNAWNGQHVAEYLHQSFPQAHVVAFHYRGYRPSDGRPSAQALLRDAPLVLRTAREQVGPERTIAVGFSIGSGIAASLGGEVDGMILVTPFDSLKAAAAQLYPWLPIGLMFQHEIDSVALLAGSRVPVAILAAERDEIIAPARTDGLRAKTANLVFDRTIARAGHNDIYARDDFQKAMRAALVAVSAK